MKALAQIFLYLAATVLIGALLAPPLYWLAHLVAGELPGGKIVDFLTQTEFHRFFDRAILIAALLLLWPLLGALKVRDFGEDLGLRRDRRGWRHLFSGFLAAFLTLLLLGAIMLLLDVCHLRGHIPYGRLAWLPLNAAAVALLEEWLFRGALQGAVRKTTVDGFAIVTVAVIFAAVHFLKPPADASPEVFWWSGLGLLPSAFWQFGQPLLLLGGFSTLLLAGLILGYARWRTRSLWMPVGLHAGWIIGKMGFLKATRQPEEAWPWFGPDILTGLAPILTLLFVWALVWWMLRDERVF